MGSNTSRLNLYKSNPVTDGENTFNVDTLMNENWDKIDANVAKKTEIPTIPTSLPANGGNSTTVNQHTAAATPSTTEKTDLIGMTNEVKNEIDTHKAETMTYSVYKSNIDSNGIYTQVDHKRSDGTLIISSVLSGGTSPNYTTKTETKYATNGTTVEWTKTYAITYDTNGNVSSEVLNL